MCVLFTCVVPRGYELYFTFYPEGIISFPSIMKKPFLDYQEYSAKKKQVQMNLAYIIKAHRFKDRVTS